MSNPSATVFSFDARLSSAQESSARFQEAARNMGGILTSLGDKIRKTGIGVTLAGLTAFLANTAAVTSPAQAEQVALTARQCEDAISISTGIMSRYKGRMSADLARSFGRFRNSKCDLNTDWSLVTDADKSAFGEFRLHLVAMRREASAKAAALTSR